VVVDRPHLEKLRAALPAREAQLKLRPAGGDDPQRAALVVLDGRGCCTFLDEARLCTVMSRFGEDALPDACATYPRRVRRSGTRHELAGTVSCPEVARMVLADADALELVPAGPELFGRGLIHHRVEAGGEEAFDRVRTHLLDLLAWEAEPLPARLFAVAAFGLAGPIDLEEARQHLEAFDPPPGFAMSVVRAVVELPPLRPLVVAALDADTPRLPRPAPVDEWLTRYARHHVLREWHVRAASPSAYVLGLLVASSRCGFSSPGTPSRRSRWRAARSRR
jgi:hypothetical protein